MDYNFILSYPCPICAIRIFLAFKNMLGRLPHFPVFLCSWGLFVLGIVYYDFSIKSSGFDTILGINFNIFFYNNYSVQIFHYFLKHFKSFSNPFHWYKTEYSYVVIFRKDVRGVKVESLLFWICCYCLFIID